MEETTFEFPIDLHLLEVDRVPAHMNDALPRLWFRKPRKGDTVVAVDEDRARYFAVIDRVYRDGIVDLVLNLQSKRFASFSFVTAPVTNGAHYPVPILTSEPLTRTI